VSGRVNVVTFKIRLEIILTSELCYELILICISYVSEVHMQTHKHKCFILTCKENLDAFIDIKIELFMAQSNSAFSVWKVVLFFSTSLSFPSNMNHTFIDILTHTRD